ncbi:MAG: DUF6348 family protein [Flavobacteriaceae bacterium]|jgi:hypothetical protein|nr:DUF6348 family protein [Flavobacteriaceae bacterium]
MTTLEILANILRAHELNILEYKDWILVDEQLPAISASTREYKEYEKGASIRLDITLLLGNKKVIRESFEGIGKDEISATQNAFQNFAANSLYVLLSAFWQVKNEEQTGVEEWDIQGNLWNVYIGNFGCKGDFNIPHDLFKTIEEQIQKEDLKEDIYWLQFYYANINGKEKIIETLKNNENWPELLNKIKNVDWDDSDKFYSLRNFIILKRK